MYEYYVYITYCVIICKFDIHVELKFAVTLDRKVLWKYS